MAKNRGFWIKQFFTVIAILSVILFLDFIKPISVANTFMPNRLQKIIRMPIKTDYHDYS